MSGRGGLFQGVIAAVAATLVAASMALGGVARAAPAVPERVPAPEVTGAVAAEAGPCAPRLNSFDRTRLCVLVSGRVDVLRGAAPIGAITFGVTHFMQLRARSRDFTERITISGVHVTGSASGVRLSVRVSCASPCSATVHFPGDPVIADGLSATVDYHDSVAAGRAQETRSLYTLEFTKPGDQSGSFSYRLPIAYRCDDELPGVPAGCVLPAYPPTLAAREAAGNSGVARFYAANRVLNGDSFWVAATSPGPAPASQE